MCSETDNGGGGGGAAGGRGRTSACGECGDVFRFSQNPIKTLSTGGAYLAKPHSAKSESAVQETAKPESAKPGNC